jgi:hypothetical protein
MYWQLGYIYSLWKMPIIGHSVLLFYGLYAVIDQQILNDYSGAFVCSNDVLLKKDVCRSAEMSIDGTELGVLSREL